VDEPTRRRLVDQLEAAVRHAQLAVDEAADAVLASRRTARKARRAIRQSASPPDEPPELGEASTRPGP